MGLSDTQFGLVVLAVLASVAIPCGVVKICIIRSINKDRTVVSWDVRFGTKVGQIEPEWDKSGNFQIRFQYEMY